jgi:sphingomyelin phosphodiesterase 2
VFTLTGFLQLHAPYEREPNDSYLCHRTSQAWEISKLLRASRAKGRLGVALGDFNMLPLSLAHQLLTTHGAALDTWRVLHPLSSIGAAIDEPEKARGQPIPNAEYNLLENGATCDSVMNTWRWDESLKRALKRGEDVEIDPSTEDPRAKRLDYIFLGGTKESWRVTAAAVGMVERHPDLKVSLSDHFSVEVTLERMESTRKSDRNLILKDRDEYLLLETYDSILEVTDHYALRERRQRRLRLWHFGIWLITSIACWVAVWWSPRNFVSFILMLVSSLGLPAGVVDGLIGGLFMSWELRALKEFQWEMENARELATESSEVRHK